MPHHTFWWEGIDGTRVFTHFPPVDTYNSDLSGETWRWPSGSTARRAWPTLSLVPFGYGDGGGGPNREMVAAAHRAASLEGSPTVRIDTPQAFFDAAAAEYVRPAGVERRDVPGAAPRHLHQPGPNQAGNRRSEHLLREAELWATTAAVRTRPRRTRPTSSSELWQLVLLQQFHDILPGSWIAWVHQDAERNYDAIERRAEAVIGAALTALAGPADRDSSLQRGSAPRGRGPCARRRRGGCPQPVTLSRSVTRSCSTTASFGSSSMAGARSARSSTPRRAGKRSRQARSGTGCSCTATSPTTGTPGTSTCTTGATWSRSTRSTPSTSRTTSHRALVVVRRSFGSSTIEQRIS